MILKLDADGALVWLDGVAHHIPPATNNLVDATGAGDSFAGAFLARYLVGATAVDAAHVRHQHLGLGDRAPRRATGTRRPPAGDPATSLMLTVRG